MKQIIVRVFLIAYCILVAKPAFPFVKDFAAHAFWSQRHHSHHDHEHGHDHVHAEVKKAADDERAPVKKTAFEKETAWVHINTEFDFRIDFIKVLPPEYNTVFISNYSFPGIGMITPPPRG